MFLLQGPTNLCWGPATASSCHSLPFSTAKRRQGTKRCSLGASPLRIVASTTQLSLSARSKNERSSAAETTSRGEQQLQGDDESALDDDDDSDTEELTTYPEDMDDADNYNGYRYSHNSAWLEEATDTLLDLVVYPPGSLSPDDIDVLTGLMAAWPRRRSVAAAVTVERLLKRVVDDMHAGSPHAAVETRMYVYCIDAWAKSGVVGAAAARAQSIHDAMVQTWKDTGNKLIAPSTVSYNALMNAWGKCNGPDGPIMAEKVLAEMMEGSANVRPDDVTFSAVLDIYAKSFSWTAPGASNMDAVRRCEEIFAMMRDQLGVEPTVYNYSALQNVYARSGIPDAAMRAERVLDRMMELYEQNDNVLAKPAAINYNGTWFW
jgi:hypothetical protein